MINGRGSDRCPNVLASAELSEGSPGVRARSSTTAPRLERAATDSFDFIWRTLRRLGVRPTAAVDDAAQRVFEIAARKRHQIEAGHERAFLFKTAILVGAEERRLQRRVRDRMDGREVGDLADPALRPDQALEERRNRTHLDHVLDALEPDLRTVFVLFELEGMSSVEIAQLLEIPAGTVASRLRRARECFHVEAKRLRARLASGGAVP